MGFIGILMSSVVSTFASWAVKAKRNPVEHGKTATSILKDS